MDNLYDVLGVGRNASVTEIEQSYRCQLNAHIAGRRERPLRKEDQRRLQRMRQAYLLLSSPARRREYDLQLGHEEHARLRAVERIGIVFGLILLVTGLVLLAQSFSIQTPADARATKGAQHAEPPVIRLALAGAAGASDKPAAAK